MSKPCSICIHPQIKEINEALDCSPTIRSVYQRFGLKSGATERHAKHRGGQRIAVAARGLGLASGQSQKLAKEVIRGAVESFRDVIARSISPDQIAKVLSAGLAAKESKFFSQNGKVTDRRDVVDFAERRLYSELALRAVGELGGDTSDGSPVEVKVEIINVGGRESDQK